jgi:exodeoxyribonuclease VII large subunit
MNSNRYYTIVEDKMDIFEQLKRLGFVEKSEAASQSSSAFLNVIVENSVASAALPVPAVGEQRLDSQQMLYSVSEFVKNIESVIKGAFQNFYWITGEITSFKTANNHVFFDLCDKAENMSLKAISVSCVLWAGKKRILSEKFEQIPWSDGTQVKVFVAVDFRKEGSRILCVVEDIDPEFTTGNLLLQRMKIVQELKKRNLYNRNKTARLGVLPLKIALITAANSRAAGDFINELKLSSLAFEVVIFDCNMQGENTSPNVCESFKMITSSFENSFDCIILSRGGGSRLDLRWFDDLEIAKSIAYAPCPVISAVGHHDDVSIACEVAFHTEKTPTAAARFFVQKVSESLNALFLRTDAISRVLLKRMEKEKNILVALQDRLKLAVLRRVEKEKKHLEHLERLFAAHKRNMEKPLEKGYALVRVNRSEPDDVQENRLLTGQDFLDNPALKKLQIEFYVKQSTGAKKVLVDVHVDHLEIIEV